MGFGQGLSGLNAAAQELDVIGNNIANAGTVGFKSSSVVFSDVYANSQVGLGVKLAAVNQNFSVGTITNTGNQLDLAIDGTSGLFRVQDENGNILYTRNGQFYADKNNFIVNAQGQKLTGYGLVGDDLSPLTVPVGNLAPKASTSIDTRMNVNANAAIIYQTAQPDTLGTIYARPDTTGSSYTQYYYRLNSDGTTSFYTDSDGTVLAKLDDGDYVLSADGTTDGTTVAVSGPTSVNGVSDFSALQTAAQTQASDTLGEIYLKGTSSSSYDHYYYRQNSDGTTSYYSDSTGTTSVDVAAGSYDTSTDGTTPGTNITLAGNSSDFTALDTNATSPYAQTLGQIALSDDSGATYTTYYYKSNADGSLAFYSDAAGTSKVNLSAGSYMTSNDGGATSNGTTTVTLTTNKVGNVDALQAQAGSNKYVAAPVDHPFSLTDRASYTHSLAVTVYDSVGNSHQLIQYFVKRTSVGSDGQWDVYYSLDGSVVNGTDPARMTFDSAGRLKTGGTVDLTIPNPGGTAAPADPLELKFSYADSTQFSGDFAYNFLQDGFPTGEYAGLSVDTDGSVVASYTNGEMRTIGYVALANFNNLNGLQASGDNAWVETGASGQPIVGRPGTNGLATLKGQAVEESNVDLSQELVNMIIAQRFYQANAQTIKTQDQIVQNLIALR